MEYYIVYQCLVQVKLFPSENVTVHYGVKSGLVEIQYNQVQMKPPGRNLHREQ